jgi:hypothetical protein
MNQKHKTHMIHIFMIAIIVGLLFSNCSPNKPATSDTITPNAASGTAPNAPTKTPTVTPIPLPVITLHQGDFYFTLDGQPAVIFLRNITGKTREDFATQLEWAHQGGSRLIRVHLTGGFWGDSWINQDWTINEKWVQDWEWFFDQAQADGIYVIPVFGVWYDWNNNIPDIGGGGLWQYNTLNQANGGPVKDPWELMQKDSATQKKWLAWVRAMVERWQSRPNIPAWEMFSEINIASGAPGEADATGAVAAASAVYLTNKLADVIHTADSFHRPLTISLAGIPWTSQWADVYRLSVIDFIQVHPYTDKLDRGLLLDVQNKIMEYKKPVMIGESGLWGDLAIARNAPIGINHAIWAGVVSGAMNARALWSEDGMAFIVSDRTLAMQYMQLYATAELPAANFVTGVDFTGFKPLTASSTGGVWGAAVGNENSIIGWYRDAQCEPPDWNLRPVISKQTVTITVPGSTADWNVDFYDTKDGTTILSSVILTRKGKTITITLPDFKDDIALKMTAVSGTVSTLAPAAFNTNAIAGNWSGTISNAAGTFSTLVELSIQPDCEVGKICGKFSAPKLSCSGELFLQETKDNTFVFIEQNIKGSSSCTANGYEYLQLRGDGTLSYEYSFTLGSANRSKGVLTHP